MEFQVTEREQENTYSILYLPFLFAHTEVGQRAAILITTNIETLQY